MSFDVGSTSFFFFFSFLFLGPGKLATLKPHFCQIFVHSLQTNIATSDLLQVIFYPGRRKITPKKSLFEGEICFIYCFLDRISYFRGQEIIPGSFQLLRQLLVLIMMVINYDYLLARP